MPQHRAAKRPARPGDRPPVPAARPAAPGKHRVVDTSARRPRRVPATPVVVGVAALVAAATGAVTLGDLAQARSPAHDTSVQASTRLTGTDGAEVRQADGRIPPQVSRDLDRARISRGAQRPQLVPDRRAQLAQAAERQAERRNAALALLKSKARQRAAEIALDRWVLPTSGYHLTAGFGDVSGLWSSVHTGLDFAAASGTPVVAVGGGTVTEAGYDGAYGNKVVLRLDDGTVTWYCHMTEFTVSVGEQVMQGEQIGTVGSTGNTTGPHLHFEVHPHGGDPVDPYAYLVDHGVTP